MSKSIHWQVQIKGNIGPNPNDYYEISVIRKDNIAGQTSWGWGGLDKIILFGTNLGRNKISPVTEETVQFALWVADTLCAALNERYKDGRTTA